MNFRKVIFWINDVLKSGTLKKELAAVSSLMSKDLATIKHEQNLLVTQLLNHAATNTEFYKPYNGKTIDKWPVIDKNLIKNIQSDFECGNLPSNKIHIASTSGSTGTPFKIKQGSIKRLRHTADLLYFNTITKQEIGDQVGYIRIWNEINSMSPLKRFITNIKQLNGADLSIENTKEFIQEINKSSNWVILGYGSTLEAHAHNIMSLIEEGFSCKNNAVKVIVTMAEPTSIEARSTLSSFFGCQVLSRYSNSENGFIAHQVNEEGYYLINQASYKVELLDLESNNPVPYGTQGRIVLTDLFNHTTPMIRYDTGDVGVMNLKKWQGKEVEVLETIEGRRLDFISSTDGKLISPHVVDYAVRAIKGIKQFQLIQEEKTKYTIKINAVEVLDNQKIEDQLKQYLGSNAQIMVHYVDEIPTLASGKRKLVINNLRKDV